LYTLLQGIDFHVIAFDYRGYADSTQIPPNETTTVADGIVVYNWIRGILGKSSTKVIIWGHSLGTGVSTHVVAKLCLAGNSPTALILESPFTSIGEEVKHHMLAALWRYMPAFDWIFTSPLKRNDLAFESDKHIGNIHIPIMILHAVDDPVVPFMLGKKLYRIGIETRGNNSKPMYFLRFGEGYAHKYICRSPALPKYVREFVRCSITDAWPCDVLDANNDLSETED
jgi:abhydrolase domain-containing protein 12